MALSHAILAALLEEACSGYDLAKRFDGSVGFFWTASHQQIYRELTRQEAQGLIVAEQVTQEGRPNKKLYQVTPAGKLNLSQWIKESGSPSSLKDDLLVKIFAGYLVSTTVMLQELRHHQAHHQERLEEYRAIAAHFFSDPALLSLQHRYQYLTLRNGIHYETAWLAWCDEAIAFFQKEETRSALPPAQGL